MLSKFLADVSSPWRKSRAWPRFAPRAIVRSPLARSSIFRVGGRPIERSTTAATSALDRHCADVRGGRDVFLSRCHRKISAAVHGPFAGRLGPLLRRLPVGTYFSQSDHPTENDDDNASVLASRSIGIAARSTALSFFALRWLFNLMKHLRSCSRRRFWLPCSAVHCSANGSAGDGGRQSASASFGVFCWWCAPALAGFIRRRCSHSAAPSVTRFT